MDGYTYNQPPVFSVTFTTDNTNGLWPGIWPTAPVQVPDAEPESMSVVAAIAEIERMLGLTDPVVEQSIVPPPEPETPEPANDPVPETDPESETESGVEPA